MSEAFIKSTTEIFEKELRRFLSLSVIERLEETKIFCDRYGKDINNDRKLVPNSIYPMIEAIDKLINDYKEEDSKPLDESREFTNFVEEQNFHSYIDSQFGNFIFTFPYILMLSHFFFENTNSPLNIEGKKELRKICGLGTRNQRKQLFNELCKSFFYEKEYNGGSEGFWDEANSLYFVACYNRYQIIIKNTREDLEKCRDTESARQKILEKYGVPQENQEDKDLIFTKGNPSEIALEWALRRIGCDVRDEAKALRIAKRKAGRLAKIGNKKLVSASRLDLNLPIMKRTLSSKARLELRFGEIKDNRFNALYYV